MPVYRKARRGETVELPARPVTIYGIELLAWCRGEAFPGKPVDSGIGAECLAPTLTIEVTCGPGTYIRSLTHDLGQSLGCGAVLTALTRIRSGQFKLEDAVSLDALADAARAGELARYLHPLEAALGGLTRVPVDAAQAARLAHGQFLPCPTPPDVPTGYAVAEDGAVVAILAYDMQRSAWKPEKVFVTGNE